MLRCREWVRDLISDNWKLRPSLLAGSPTRMEATTNRTQYIHTSILKQQVLLPRWYSVTSEGAVMMGANSLSKRHGAQHGRTTYTPRVKEPSACWPCCTNSNHRQFPLRSPACLTYRFLFDPRPRFGNATCLPFAWVLILQRVPY